MSRIDTRNNTAITQPPIQSGIEGKSKLNDAATPQAVKRFSNIRSKFSDAKNLITKTRKNKKLVSASDIEETDLQPLSGKNRDQMMGELSRILVAIDTYEDARGEDETSQLCKMMLGEHVRRLSLVSGTEVVSDGLKGSA
jgi:hypothetical protein